MRNLYCLLLLLSIPHITIHNQITTLKYIAMEEATGEGMNGWGRLLRQLKGVKKSTMLWLKFGWSSRSGRDGDFGADPMKEKGIWVDGDGE